MVKLVLVNAASVITFAVAIFSRSLLAVVVVGVVAVTSLAWLRHCWKPGMIQVKLPLASGGTRGSFASIARGTKAIGDGDQFLWLVEPGFPIALIA